MYLSFSDFISEIGKQQAAILKGECVAVVGVTGLFLVCVYMYNRVIISEYMCMAHFLCIDDVSAIDVQACQLCHINEKPIQCCNITCYCYMIIHAVHLVGAMQSTNWA